MLKVYLSVVVLALGLGIHAPLPAQETGRSFGLLLTHSVGSGGPGRITPGQCPLGFCWRSDEAGRLELSTVEIEMAWPLLRHSWWGLEYATTVPVALVRNNPTGTARRRRTGEGWVILNPPPPITTLGFGLKPVGLRGWAGPHQVRLQADVSAGFLLFNSPLLAANAARFNFTAELGIGVRVDIPERGHAVLGYRKHHVSNGGLGEINPGLSSHLLYVGLSFN